MVRSQAGNHRQRIGDEDAIELGATEKPFGIEGRRVADGEAHSSGRLGPTKRAGGCRQHLGRDVEAVERGGGVVLCREHEVAAGAAAEFQHAAAGRHVEMADQAIAAQKVELSRGVVDMALPPIDRVHQRGMPHAGFGAGHRSFFT